MLVFGAPYISGLTVITKVDCIIVLHYPLIYSIQLVTYPGHWGRHWWRCSHDHWKHYTVTPGSRTLSRCCSRYEFLISSDAHPPEDLKNSAAKTVYQLILDNWKLINDILAFQFWKMILWLLYIIKHKIESWSHEHFNGSYNDLNSHSQPEYSYE